MSKKKLQVGNYLISSEGNQVERIKIEAVSGNWNVKFADFNPQFRLIRGLANDESRHKDLELIITLMYLSCNCVPDEPFMVEFEKSFRGLSERFAARMSKEPTEEENKADIEAAKDIYELQKEDNMNIKEIDE